MLINSQMTCRAWSECEICQKVLSKSGCIPIPGKNYLSCIHSFFSWCADDHSQMRAWFLGPLKYDDLLSFSRHPFYTISLNPPINEDWFILAGISSSHDIQRKEGARGTHMLPVHNNSSQSRRLPWDWWECWVRLNLIAAPLLPLLQLLPPLLKPLAPLGGYLGQLGHGVSNKNHSRSHGNLPNCQAALCGVIQAPPILLFTMEGQRTMSVAPMYMAMRKKILHMRMQVYVYQSLWVISCPLWWQMTKMTEKKIYGSPLVSVDLLLYRVWGGMYLGVWEGVCSWAWSMQARVFSIIRSKYSLLSLCNVQLLSRPVA